MFQSKVIHRPGVFKWDLGAPANILSCSHLGSVWFVYGLDPHSMYHCKQLHADSLTYARVSAGMCAQLHTQSQTYPQDSPCKRAHRANRGHLRIHTHTHRQIPRALPTSSLASCRPRARMSRLPTGGLILPPAAEGGGASQCQPAPGPEWPHRTHCVLLVSSLLFKLKFQYKMSLCVHACIYIQSMNAWILAI